MDWIAAGEATLGASKEIKKAFVAFRYKPGGVAFPGSTEAENSE